jgi:hypothetical protein
METEEFSVSDSASRWWQGRNYLSVSKKEKPKEKYHG